MNKIQDLVMDLRDLRAEVRTLRWLLVVMIVITLGGNLAQVGLC